ncbi:MAG: DUF3048 domain-containing protein [Lachnospiraceae bacterium]|nr:DUF3048 domain-containing protein [Lachnospiraceae bacterium]
MKRKIVMLAVMLVVTASLWGCGKNPGTEAEADGQKTETEEDSKEEKIYEREYNENGQVRSFLTGKWVDAQIGERRPVAVMLSNIKEANPMCGVSKADVVFEAPVEGEITRMMGIFEDYDDLEKIGSVRSCREYFLFWALEFDAVYAHWGQSSYAVEYLERDYVDNLSGLGSIGSTVFYRTDDRPAPHNAYASAKGIKEGIKKLKYRTDYRDTYGGKFKFAKDGEILSLTGADGQVGRATYIAPGYYINKPWFEYKEEDKLYYRFQYGDKHIDEMTGEQLAFTNVIIQYADWEQRDDKGYLAFDCHSEGYALIFTNGTCMEAHWMREGDQDDGVIRYYDIGLENEITLNQGKTMVCVVEDRIGGKINGNVTFH